VWNYVDLNRFKRLFILKGSINSSSAKEASGDHANEYLLISQHKNALTGPAGYLKRRAAPMKAIVGESLAWLPVLEQAKNKTHIAK
jgi:hypothetical protein